MRKKYGVTARSDNGGSERDLPEVPAEKQSPEKDDGPVRKREFSRLEVIAAAATLTLGIIRVIREASDLYSKVFPDSGGAGSR